MQCPPHIVNHSIIDTIPCAVVYIPVTIFITRNLCTLIPLFIFLHEIFLEHLLGTRYRARHFSEMTSPQFISFFTLTLLGLFQNSLFFFNFILSPPLDKRYLSPRLRTSVFFQRAQHHAEQMLREQKLLANGGNSLKLLALLELQFNEGLLCLERDDELFGSWWIIVAICADVSE